MDYIDLGQVGKSKQLTQVNPSVTLYHLDEHQDYYHTLQVEAFNILNILHIDQLFLAWGYV